MENKSDMMSAESQIWYIHILHLPDQQPPNKFGAESLSELKLTRIKVLTRFNGF